MADKQATIIPFPKKERVKALSSKRSADLYHAWNTRLANPKLSKTYRPEISWVERWYLESRHLANKEMWDSPILQTLMYDREFNDFLRQCCLDDIRLMEKLAEDPVYRDSSVTQRRRLIIWHNKFASFILNQETGTP